MPKASARTAALAERLGVALPQSRVTLAQLEAAINEGFAARDMAAMVPYMEDKTR
ncbi:MAG: FaeA-like protein [Rhodobacteraceae bacterium HLUCCO18]|nr:MAG: FaeA-like protein [Rhodobacteraceae bacterium HLUCCO18]